MKAFPLEPIEKAPQAELKALQLERMRWSLRHAGRDIVAVAHGGTIRAALGHALGLTPARALVFETANCALTRLDYIEDAGKAPAWRVVTVNLRPAH